MTAAPSPVRAAPGSPLGSFSVTVTMKSSPVGDSSLGSCKQGVISERKRSVEMCNLVDVAPLGVNPHAMPTPNQVRAALHPPVAGPCL